MDEKRYLLSLDVLNEFCEILDTVIYSLIYYNCIVR